jgi:hypothetical protein
MSDFFTRLMDRSSGSADVLRPRRFSFFEPATSESSTAANLLPLTRNLGAILDQDGLSGVIRQNYERNEQGSTRAPEISSRHGKEISTDRFEGVEISAEMPSHGVELQPGTEPALERERSPQSDGSTNRAQNAHQQPPSLLEPEVRLASGVTKKGLAGHPKSAAPVSDDFSQERVLLVAEERLNSAIPLEGDAVRQVSPVPINNDSSPATPGRFSHRGVHDSAVSMDVQKMVLGPEAGIASPAARVKHLFLEPILPKEHGSKRKSTNAETPEFSPSINITIGRVEVRASVSESARRKEQKDSPVMGLEDYLKRHGSGASR